MCHAKKGGIVNMILSWPGFAPVGKLWLLIYLVHPFVIFQSNGTLRAPVYYTKKQLVSDLSSLPTISSRSGFFQGTESSYTLLELVVPDHSVVGTSIPRE